MAIDPHLAALVAEVEAKGSASAPSVSLIVGGTFITGNPAKSDEFEAVSYHYATKELQAHLQKRPRRDKKENPVDASDVADERMQAIPQHDQSNTVLTLLDAFVALPDGSGGGLKVPTMRVPLGSIDAWWVAGGRWQKGGGGSGWFVGGGIVTDI